MRDGLPAIFKRPNTTTLHRPICLAVLLVSAYTVRAQETANVYAAHCANCHGRDGRGNTPLGRASKVRDLRSQDVQNLSDGELQRIIGKGAAGGKMPGFAKKLGAEQINQLAAYVHNLDRLPDAPLPVKQAHARAASDVASIYSAKCSHCHGTNGGGDTVLGHELKLPDLRSKARTLSDRQLLAVIAHGTSDGRMAGFQKKLGPEIVEQLASYVRKIAGGASISPDSSEIFEAAKNTARTAEPSVVAPQSQTPSKEPAPTVSAKPVEPAASPVTEQTPVNSAHNVSPSATAPKLVDLNSADKQTLMTLPGLSEQDADKIISGRPYKSTLQFKIKGVVSAETYDRIARYIIAKRVRNNDQPK